jgi:hypothetical protein
MGPILSLFKESVDAFVLGYRDALALHNTPDPLASPWSFSSNGPLASVFPQPAAQPTPQPAAPPAAPPTPTSQAPPQGPAQAPTQASESPPPESPSQHATSPAQSAFSAAIPPNGASPPHEPQQEPQHQPQHQTQEAQEPGDCSHPRPACMAPSVPAGPEPPDEAAGIRPAAGPQEPSRGGVESGADAGRIR